MLNFKQPPSFTHVKLKLIITKIINSLANTNKPAKNSTSSTFLLARLLEDTSFKSSKHPSSYSSKHPASQTSQQPANQSTLNKVLQLNATIS